MSNQNDYCAIVFIGGGSSWHWGSTPKEAAEAAVKVAKKDWGKFYDFTDVKVKANVYDMKGRSGWYADERGVFDDETNEKLERCELIEIAA